MVRRWFAALALLLVAIVAVPAAAAQPGATPVPAMVPAIQPAANDSDGAVLYFFWGDGCPHCAAAKPVLASLQDRYPAFTVRDFEVWKHPENVAPFTAMAEAFGFEPSGVPTLFLGTDYWVGWSDAIQADVERAVAACVADGCPDAGAGVIADAPSPSPSPSPTPAPTDPANPGPAEPPPGYIELPLFGRIDTTHQSLVVTTALIALVDGFNPCSLWVLTVLLALTLRTGSRRKTVIIGLVFISVTALVYALFIAGMFTFLTIVSIAPWVRVLVALVALAFALVNIKDYFWFREGISFTIPDEKKPGIYRRIRSVTASADSMPALVTGTVALAAGVSVVELACTAGFPVLWTNILADQGVGAATFVLLLLLYMVIYQLDELAVFGTAVVTLRASKLEEKHGRVLKLVGGMLMLTLAVVMIIDPTLMTTLGSALLVFGAALAATVLVLLVHRVVLPRFGIRIGTEEKHPAGLGAASGGQTQGGSAGTRGAAGTRQGGAAGTAPRVDSRGKPVARSKPRGR